jgi:hypothetical protein
LQLAFSYFSGQIVVIFFPLISFCFTTLFFSGEPKNIHLFLSLVSFFFILSMTPSLNSTILSIYIHLSFFIFLSFLFFLYFFSSFSFIIYDTHTNLRSTSFRFLIFAPSYLLLPLSLFSLFWCLISQFWLFYWAKGFHDTESCHIFPLLLHIFWLL